MHAGGGGGGMLGYQKHYEWRLIDYTVELGFQASHGERGQHARRANRSKLVHGRFSARQPSRKDAHTLVPCRGLAAPAHSTIACSAQRQNCQKCTLGPPNKKRTKTVYIKSAIYQYQATLYNRKNRNIENTTNRKTRAWRDMKHGSIPVPRKFKPHASRKRPRSCTT